MIRVRIIRESSAGLSESSAGLSESPVEDITISPSISNQLKWILDQSLISGFSFKFKPFRGP
jgi:hypothetical protein